MMAALHILIQDYALGENVYLYVLYVLLSEYFFCTYLDILTKESPVPGDWVNIEIIKMSTSLLLTSPKSNCGFVTQ